MSYSKEEFETIFKSLFRHCHALAFRLLDDDEEARDTVQDAMMRLWESGKRPDDERAWLMATVRNASLNRLAALDVRRRFALSAINHDAENEYDDEEIRADLDRTVERLCTPAQQRTIACVFRRGMSYRECADELDISLSTVNKHVVGALKALRNHFKTK